jgi:hypothetical protein
VDSDDRRRVAAGSATDGQVGGRRECGGGLLEKAAITAEGGLRGKEQPLLRRAEFGRTGGRGVRGACVSFGLSSDQHEHRFYGHHLVKLSTHSFSRAPFLNRGTVLSKEAPFYLAPIRSGYSSHRFPLQRTGFSTGTVYLDSRTHFHAAHRFMWH